MRKVGIICEDDSDYKSLVILINKIRNTTPIKSDRFLARSCGRISVKCAAWIRLLKLNACNIFIIAQDLDRNRLDVLEEKLKRAALSSGERNYYICIPTEEIEAWILADATCINKRYRLKNKIKPISNPEAQNSPKEHIKKLVRQHSSNKNYYSNTMHNPELFNLADLNALLKCVQFRKFHEFVTGNI